MRRTVTIIALALAVLPLGGGALAAPGIDTLVLQGYSPETMKLFYQLDTVDEEVDVTGPHGHVNHGSVVAAFIAALREDGVEGGIGCAVSSLARTDLGRTEETQVRDADDEATTVASEAVADIDLSDVENRCVPDDDPETDGGKPAKKTGHGKPDWAGPDAATGNPGQSHRP